MTATTSPRPRPGGPGGPGGEAGSAGSAGSAAQSRTDTSPLTGVRVLEIDDGFAGYAGKVFADFGASVVKVERPGGALQRRSGPFYRAADGNEYSLPFAYYNAGKQSVLLDLPDAGRPDADRPDADRPDADRPDAEVDADAIAQLERLIAGADVVLDGMSGGITATLGLSSERLAELRPGLIHVVITPFGLTGPWRDYLSSDLVALTLGGVTAQTGYDSVNGRPGQPISPTGGQSSHFVGVLAAIATIAALRERRDRRAEDVLTLDFSVHDSVAVSTESYVSMWEFGNLEGFRHTGRHASGIFTNPAWQFRCGDGAYVCALTLYLNDRRFAALLDLFDKAGFSHGLADERYATQRQRDPIMNEIVNEIARFCKQHSADYIFDEAQRRQLPWAKVRSPEDIAADAHLAARGFFTPVELFPGEQVPFPGMPWQGLPSALLATDANAHVPQLGQDTEALLNQEGWRAL
ncbi:MAG: carnitine dehydratase [Frankiales bacterium]|nr:carnitine dehydratase [Frankiales bacterium]